MPVKSRQRAAAAMAWLRTALVWSGIVALAVAAAPAVQAQVAAGSGPHAAAGIGKAAAAAAQTRPVTDVLGEIGRGAGITVLADDTVRASRVAFTAPAATTPEAAEQQIADVVKQLPAGTTWARLYLPAPVNGRWNADVVSEYARAQAQLVGTVGAAAPVGTVEILGRHVPADQAQTYIAGLNLKLVYLVTNPRRQQSRSWTEMSQDDRVQAAHDQAQQYLSMDPTTMAQALGQMMQQSAMVMKQVMNQLSPDQREAVLNAMGALGDGKGKMIFRYGGPGN